jgi:topoisomerase-4 subunit A
VQVKPELVFNYRLKNGDKRTKEIILLDFIDVKGWKANGNKLGGFSRMSGFKINELQVEAATDAPTTDTPVEQKDIPIEAPKDANGDELSLF